MLDQPDRSISSDQILTEISQRMCDGFLQQWNSNHAVG